jgi:hypothetical protein
VKQADLNRAVARATGESISTVKRLGFLIDDDPDLGSDDLDPSDTGPAVIDWDELQARRVEPFCCEPDCVPAPL